MVSSTGKNISKSVRLKSEVAAYIEDYRGDNFSTKLENLVLDAVMGETDRKKRFAAWDDRIRRREREYEALCDRYGSALALFRELAALEPHVRRILAAAEPLQDPADANP